MASLFAAPSRIVTGSGSLTELGTEASRLGRRVLLVTGRSGLRAAGVTDRAIGVLRSAGLSVALFDEVAPEPTIGTVDYGRRALARARADVVVGAGGGSAMDVAKAIAGLASAEEPTAVFHGGKPVPETGVPVVTIPTTSGSGAEVTHVSVLTDPERQIKQSIRGESMRPSAVILDPELTVPLPPGPTAASGMDALTQAIESFWSTGATPLSEALSWEAARLIDSNIRTATHDGANLPAREAMAYGSLMAGLALAAARLGAVHGVAHPLGWQYKIPHGVCCAALLPHVMRLNREAASEKYARLERLFGADPAEHVERLLDDLDLPRTLTDYGLQVDDFLQIVSNSMPSGSLKANPKPVTEQDVEAILHELL